MKASTTKHHLFVNEDSTVELCNEDDSYYSQIFRTAEELRLFVEHAIAVGQEAFGEKAGKGRPKLVVNAKIVTIRDDSTVNYVFKVQATGTTQELDSLRAYLHNRQMAGFIVDRSVTGATEEPDNT